MLTANNINEISSKKIKNQKTKRKNSLRGIFFLVMTNFDHLVKRLSVFDFYSKRRLKLREIHPEDASD